MVGLLSQPQPAVLNDVMDKSGISLSDLKASKPLVIAGWKAASIPATHRTNGARIRALGLTQK